MGSPPIKKGLLKISTDWENTLFSAPTKAKKIKRLIINTFLQTTVCGTIDEGTIQIQRACRGQYTVI